MSRFIPIQELIKLPMLAADDILMRSKGKLLTYSKYLYTDMNFSTFKIAKRRSYDINKRTNTVDLHKNTLLVSSVNVMDNCGVLWPVYKNDKLRLDLVDISAKKDCSCEKNCSYKLCNTIKGYESITSVKTDQNPDGSTASFTCVDRLAVDDQGFFIQQIQYPKRIYTAGVWTSTILYTESIRKCKVEVDANGCVCDTPNNIQSVCEAVGLNSALLSQLVSVSGIPIGGDSSTPPAPGVNKWIYYQNTAMNLFANQCGTVHSNHFNNIYNISETGDRLIFPSNFGFNKVVVRTYESVDLNNMQIPLIAAPTFVTGLRWYEYRWKTDIQSLKIADKFEQDFSKQNWALQLDLNKYRIREMGTLLTPHVNMPTFLNEYGRI